MTHSSLLEKYNVAAPRYTSYPTVPYWDDTPITQLQWQEKALHAFRQEKAISLYIHLPYCEQLCTYCGCNKRITKNHRVESPYIDSVLAEWALYCEHFDEKPIIKELHLGGGTPTFFSPLQLQRLVNGILAKAEVADEYEFSFEAHPNSTTKAHLQALFEVGFMRISVGVQDFDAQIMRIINRSQSEAEVRQVTQWARDIGYTSINFDLIFGLPLQTPAHIERNMALLQELRPDRLAFYSYAHVPWIKPSQRAYSEADLPKGKAKRHLYELGRTLLEAMGYCEIGLDHFALRSDGLYKALQSGALHRNFMGYTPHYTRLSIGLGVSAISDSWDGYVQNEKKIKVYKKRVAAGEIPFFRGHLLSAEDEQIRQHILNLMCRYETTWAMTKGTDESWYASLHRLEELMRDELVEYAPFQLKVTERGRPFVRNICLAFDARYWRRQPEGQLFSAVV